MCNWTIYIHSQTAIAEQYENLHEICLTIVATILTGVNLLTNADYGSRLYLGRDISVNRISVENTTQITNQIDL